MNKRYPRFWGATILSLVVALILMLLPLPEWLTPWRPEWAALTIMHWGFVLSNRGGFLAAWITGLCVDTLFDSMLGLHAMGYTLMLFVTLYASTRMNERNLVQQTLLITFALASYLLFKLWISGVTGNPNHDYVQYWTPLLSSLIIWPFYNAFLNLFHVKKKTL